MTHWTLLRRSLRFYTRSHLAVLLGATVASAVLIGALVVGDSVRASLHALALSRLGTINVALASNDRFFREQLGDDLATELQPENARSFGPKTNLVTSAGLAPVVSTRAADADVRW